MAKSNVYKKRLDTVKKILKDNNIDAILIYGDYHKNTYIKWICGYRPLLFSYIYVDFTSVRLYDIDYLINIAKKNINLNINIYPITEDCTNTDLKKICKNIKRLGIAGDIPYYHIKDINCEIKDISSVFDLRILEKSNEEINQISISAHILSSALKKISYMIKKGVNLLDIEKKLRIYLLSNGEDLAFPISISAGSMLKKTTVDFPSNYTLKDKDIICIDAGVIKNSFASDATRCYFINNAQMSKYYKLLLSAHYDVISNIKINMRLYDIVELYYVTLRKYNLPYDTLEVADLGHSIGFYVHEVPFIYKDEYKDFILKNNMIFALEPEITIDGYKIRVEDMVLIQKNNNKILTL